MSDDSPAPHAPSAKTAARQARRDRLAAELRANLRRRKAQVRARAEPDATDGVPPPPAEPGD